ncbi:uncharacterized protein LOC109787907 [Cajanus cajan]|uniref:uncharacterized protein LOC109787907 n=1 Tax=Cajanus cajan TaxID=3821 RepID=UPI00098DAA0E|nr:uncharacterized protein LOC109787907 [Cajanus cajan]
METPLPFGWKPLHIDRYDSTTDSDEHIDLYTMQYATSRPHHVTSAALASLRQGDDESLRTFMERVADISVKIQNLNPKVALHAMLIALKPGPFVDSLCREAPRDMMKLGEEIDVSFTCSMLRTVNDLVVKWSNLNLKKRGRVRGKSQAKPDHGHKDKMKVNNDSQFKKSARANKGGRYDFYTPLSATRVHILEEASNNNLLTLPPPGHSPNNTDRTKHCRYHRNHGHTIEECRILRDRIEELVQAGHLEQYVQR